MKTENSELLSLTFQPLHMERKLFMSFTAGFAFDLASGRPLEPGAAYAAAMGALLPGDCLDLGVPKKEAEWLLAGSAFVSGGASAKGAVVSAQVGEGVRRLLVESREPFASMPLSWKNTWGSDAENPDGPRAGKGEKASVSDEAMPHGAPACMGPRGTWPCRMGRTATYDSKWLRENWPGVPDDFDWGYYNLSQPQQRLPKGLNGGEKITLSFDRMEGAKYFAVAAGYAHCDPTRCSAYAPFPIDETVIKVKRRKKVTYYTAGTLAAGVLLNSEAVTVTGGEGGYER